LIIGDRYEDAHNCSIITGQHKFDVPDKTIIDSGYVCKPVSIGSDVWIGTGTVILQGIKIHDGAVVEQFSCYERCGVLYGCGR